MVGRGRFEVTGNKHELGTTRPFTDASREWKVQMSPVFTWDLKPAAIPSLLTHLPILRHHLPLQLWNNLHRAWFPRFPLEKEIACFHAAHVVLPVTLPGQLLSSPSDHASSFTLKDSVTLNLSNFYFLKAADDESCFQRLSIQIMVSRLCAQFGGRVLT